MNEFIEPDERLVEVLTDSEGARAITRIRRTINELPDLPSSINPVNVILCYEVWGLDDYGIAEATGLSISMVQNIMTSEIYSTMKQEVIAGLIENAQQTVQGVLNSHALQAAESLARHAQSSERASDEISASLQILDRTGHSVKQITEHRHKLDGELRIRYVKRERKFENVEIELNPATDSGDS